MTLIITVNHISIVFKVIYNFNSYSFDMQVTYNFINMHKHHMFQYPWIGILYSADLSNCFTSISLNCTLGSLDTGKGLSEK